MIIVNLVSIFNTTRNLELKMKAIDYKGKHFIIVDDIDGDDCENQYIDVSKIIESDDLLLAHVESCNYYGIPAYLGKDKDLHARIKAIEDKLDLEIKKFQQ